MSKELTLTDRAIDFMAIFLSSLRDESRRVERAIGDAREAIVFGTGGSATPVREYLAREGITTTHFCDNDPAKWGATCDDLPVLSPTELSEHPGVLVAIASSWARDIALQLRSLGVETYADFTYFLNPRFEGHADLEFLEAHTVELQRLYDMLDDEESRAALRGVLAYRATKDPAHLEVAAYDQYWCPECMVRPGDVVIDAGGWEGDTALAFVHACEGDCHVLSFEPFNTTFDALQATLGEDALGARVTSVNAGLSDEDGPACMAADEFSSAENTVCDDGGEVVSMTRLDTYLRSTGLQPTLIKMDIEGSEAAALRGARGTIAAGQVRLMISLYHRREDLWELPFLARQLDPTYRIRIGHHEQSLPETVMYAIPSDAADGRAGSDV